MQYLREPKQDEAIAWFEQFRGLLPGNLKEAVGVRDYGVEKALLGSLRVKEEGGKEWEWELGRERGRVGELEEEVIGLKAEMGRGDAEKGRLNAMIERCGLPVAVRTKQPQVQGCDTGMKEICRHVELSYDVRA